MANPEISLAISATSFGLVIGFFAGYATRAYHTFVAVRKAEQRRRQALLAKATTTTPCRYNRRKPIGV
jgi:hypothetical protein